MLIEEKNSLYEFMKHDNSCFFPVHFRPWHLWWRHYIHYQLLIMPIWGHCQLWKDTTHWKRSATCIGLDWETREWLGHQSSLPSWAPPTKRVAFSKCRDKWLYPGWVLGVYTGDAVRCAFDLGAQVLSDAAAHPNETEVIVKELSSIALEISWCSFPARIIMNKKRYCTIKNIR